MKIYLSTWLEESQKEALNKVGYIYRLFSFFFLRQEKGFLRQYQNQWRRDEIFNNKKV